MFFTSWFSVCLFRSFLTLAQYGLPDSAFLTVYSAFTFDWELKILHKELIRILYEELTFLILVNIDNMKFCFFGGWWWFFVSLFILIEGLLWGLWTGYPDLTFGDKIWCTHVSKISVLAEGLSMPRIP